MRDLASRLPEVLDMDPLYVTQELVYFGYFQDPPTLTDTGTALDILRGKRWRRGRTLSTR